MTYGIIGTVSFPTKCCKNTIHGNRISGFSANIRSFNPCTSNLCMCEGRDFVRAIVDQAGSNLTVSVKSSSGRDKLRSLTGSHINCFPMLNAKNPDLGLDHFEHNPIVTYTQLPVAFQ